MSHDLDRAHLWMVYQPKNNTWHGLPMYRIWKLVSFSHSRYVEPKCKIRVTEGYRHHSTDQIKLSIHLASVLHTFLKRTFWNNTWNSFYRPSAVPVNQAVSSKYWFTRSWNYFWVWLLCSFQQSVEILLKIELLWKWSISPRIHCCWSFTCFSEELHVFVTGGRSMLESRIGIKQSCYWNRLHGQQWMERTQEFQSELPSQTGRLQGYKPLSEGDIYPWADTGTVRRWQQNTGVWLWWQRNKRSQCVPI